MQKIRKEINNETDKEVEDLRKVYGNEQKWGNRLLPFIHSFNE